LKVEQKVWREKEGWLPYPSDSKNLESAAQLVLCFGSTNILKKHKKIQEIKKMYPKAYVIGCSTAGEICDTHVFDNSLVVTAVHFEHTKVKAAKVSLNNMKDSFSVGEKLAKSLDKKELVHAFVLSDGLHINGSELVKGLVKNLPKNISVTGGLAGDGDRFKSANVIWDGALNDKAVVILGFYGKKLKVGYGSLGGWDPFGPERLITNSKRNILYELDGNSAIELYKKYLGAYAKKLPASGLLFPLSVRSKGRKGVVRTILSIDEKDQGMIFAGDVPEGAYAQFMKANFDRLIDGAIGAAEISRKATKNKLPQLAILISCVGRKMVLQQRVEEEVEGARDVLGEQAVLTGFYSYGEIAPFSPSSDGGCELHNQTMTITTFFE